MQKGDKVTIIGRTVDLKHEGLWYGKHGFGLFSPGEVVAVLDDDIFDVLGGYSAHGVQFSQTCHRDDLRPALK